MFLAIVMGHQSLSTEAPDVIQQFKHNLSLASSSKNDKQRKDALAYLTTQLSAEPPVNPVGTTAILSKLLPLISDSSTPVRQQLLKLLQSLPHSTVGAGIDHAAMFVRAGMTHLSSDISSDALGIMDWLLVTAGDKLVSCPGGWVKTLNTFCAVMGWTPTTKKGGWTAGSAGRTSLKSKDALNRARQITSLTGFLREGFKEESTVAWSSSQYWDNLYVAPRGANPFDYINLSGARRDEDGEMYPDSGSRKAIYQKRFQAAINEGIENIKKEGGVGGRAAAGLQQVISKAMDNYGTTAALDTKDLLDLW